MKDPQPHSSEDMVKELLALRQEVQQLRQMVNMLLDMVVEPEEEDEWSIDPLNRKGGPGGKNMMCM